MKIPQRKNNSGPPRPVQRTSLVGQGTVGSSEIEDTERETVQLEESLLEKKSEMINLDKAIKEKQQHVTQLKEELEIDKIISAQLLEKAEKKSAEAQINFEKANKTKQEKISAIEKLTKDRKASKSETSMLQGTLTEYKRYRHILFKLAPPEWCEALKAEGQSDGEAQDEQNKKPQESAVRQGFKSSPGRVLPSTKEPTLSSANSSTLLNIAKLENNTSEDEVSAPEPSSPLLLEKFYFSDPQQLLEVVKELTEQNLSLTEHSTREEGTVERLRQATETTSKKNKEEEKQLTMQVNDMKDRLDREKARVAALQMKVQLHDTLRTKDEDVMLEALGVKVTKVHSSCIDSRFTHLSTIEMLSSIEQRIYSLLQQIEDLPEEDLKTLQQIKDSKRKSRLHAAKLRMERERQRATMEKCKKRSMNQFKKQSGRKLMPRCIPVERKIIVSEDDHTAEDELHAYLFSTEDVE